MSYIGTFHSMSSHLFTFLYVYKHLYSTYHRVCIQRYVAHVHVVSLFTWIFLIYIYTMYDTDMYSAV